MREDEAEPVTDPHRPERASEPVPGFLTEAKRAALRQARAALTPPAAAPAPWREAAEAGRTPHQVETLEGNRSTPAPASDLLERIVDDSRLMAAWNQVREADLEDGALSSACRQFGRDALGRLARIQSDLQSGAWQPEPPIRFQLPGSNPPRILTVSSVADRVVERAVVDVVAPIVDHHLSPFSFAYRRGLGVREAVAALTESMLAGWTHVVRTDIHHAFDETPRRRALAAFAGVVGDERVIEVLARLLCRLDRLGLDGCGIPQGSALSPLLLNLYLDSLDRGIMAQGLLPIRYADDLAVPVDGERAGLELVDVIGDELDHLGLRLNGDKTTVCAFDDAVDFLGHRIRPLGSPTSLDQHVHPRRITLYAMGAGGVARVRAGRLRIDRDGATVSAIPLSRVRQLVLGARMGVTTPLLHQAVQTGVDVVLVTEHGGYVGRFSRRRGGDVQIRRAQYRVAEDPDRSLRLAAIFVAGKIANIRVGILRDLRRRGKDGNADQHTSVARQLERWTQRALDAYSTAALMGIEGTAARLYFQWLADELDPRWQFTGRNRRPPRDPINAMLSFGYTLLTAEAVAACEVAGLDPDLGFLHSPRWGRPSLALDLVEEWRPVLVDSVVVRLARNGTVATEDFRVQGDRGCRMNQKARRAFLAAYERRMLTLASSPISHGRRAYRELLGVHARAFADSLLDPADTMGFVGYRWR